MMENYLFSIIPIVLIHTVCGETPDVPGVQFNVINPMTYKTGDIVNVICSLTQSTPSADSAKLEWFDKKGTKIAGTVGVPPYVMPVQGAEKKMLLALGPAEEDTAGKYKCVATVNEQTYEDSLEIEIRAALKFVNCKDKQFGVLGMDSEIQCTASDSKYITVWTRKPALGNSTRYLSKPTSFKILNTSSSDEGVYTLHAVDPDGIDSKDMIIGFKVYIAPTIIEPVLQTTAVVGKSATLYCNAKGKPDPKIEWKKEGSTNILQTTERIKIKEKKDGDHVQGILNFTSVRKEDDALYTCYAKNEASDKAGVTLAEGSAELTVHIPPTFEAATDGKGIEGGAASLECLARGDPIPNMVWINVKSGVRYTDGTTNNDITATKEVISEVNKLGAKLTLSFSKLKHSDAGKYKCEASNDAAEAEITVDLEVEYAPNFNDQGTTVFYNWENNPDPYITCTANGNPSPIFRWYKGDREITAGDTFHKKTETASEIQHRAISKLMVTFNGANGDAVFGDYLCEAMNQRGTNNITLNMKQAQRPGEPLVDVRVEDARHIEFWLYEPQVEGPEVTLFRVTYKEEGSSEKNPPLLEFPKEYRDHIDVTRKYTKVPVKDLKASTRYVFTFYAVNAVGPGQGRELTRMTKAKSAPGIPEIETQANSPLPTSILVQWVVPSDGGSDILYYRVTYQRVTVKTNQTYDGTRGYEILNKISPVSTKDVKDSSTTIDKLLPGQFYEIKVYAHNGEGASLPGTKVIRTQEGQTGGLSTGAIIGIVIGIFFLLFIIVDVTCYFKNNCGILMSIREKVGGGREEGYAVAKTEDAENLAKKDELTEEVKAAEEGELADAQDDEKKEPLLSEEQKVDTVDEGKPEKPELEPEEKEAEKTEQKIETPKTEQVPTEPAHEDIPAADEQPAADKPQE